MLDRWDRRIATTIILFISALVPVLHFSDVGLVLSLTGTVAATSLTYIGPGLLFIRVHGDEFLNMVENRWGCASLSQPKDHFTICDYITWYAFSIPLFCKVASMGKQSLSFYKEKKAQQTPAQTMCRLGIIKQQRLMREQLESGDETSSMLANELHAQQYSTIQVEEDSSQNKKQTYADFVVAMGFVAFGIVALSSGLLSIHLSLCGYSN